MSLTCVRRVIVAYPRFINLLISDHCAVFSVKTRETTKFSFSVHFFMFQNLNRKVYLFPKQSMISRISIKTISYVSSVIACEIIVFIWHPSANRKRIGGHIVRSAYAERRSCSIHSQH